MVQFVSYLRRVLFFLVQMALMSPKLKMLGPLCNQTVNLWTDYKAL